MFNILNFFVFVLIFKSQDPVHRPSLGDVKNRGPPPQPPPSAQKPMPTVRIC